jgi:hypothetical protein
MKKILFIWIAAFAFSILPCQAQLFQTPSSVAKRFLIALYSGDRTTILQLLDEEEGRRQDRNWRGDPEMLQMIRNSEINVMDDDLNIGKVVVFYYPKKDPSLKRNGRVASVHLMNLKRQGGWKVVAWGY